ncbi:hypothetical protein [Lachnoclostridium sp.]|uniref:hypothetical protein n=1 Tax=Lachnoclostridium sp. TaxID=2028282 RepID=UPI00289A2DC6|nr:hypothetical protein [Lachnoclostridium sp.]
MSEEILLRLKDMLNRKRECLQKILYVVKEQEKITFNKESDLEIFEEYIEEKDDLILALSKLIQENEEFIQAGEADSDRIYKDIKQQINLVNQEVISLSKEIQTLEEKSKDNFETYVRKERDKIKNFRIKNQMTSNYYKNMIGGQLEDSYFMDKRK